MRFPLSLESYLVTFYPILLQDEPPERLTWVPAFPCLLQDAHVPSRERRPSDHCRRYWNHAPRRRVRRNNTGPLLTDLRTRWRGTCQSWLGFGRWMVARCGVLRVRRCSGARVRLSQSGYNRVFLASPLRKQVVCILTRYESPECHILKVLTPIDH